jgi:hypothetical protein
MAPGFPIRAGLLHNLARRFCKLKPALWMEWPRIKTMLRHRGPPRHCIQMDQIRASTQHFTGAKPYSAANLLFTGAALGNPAGRSPFHHVVVRAAIPAWGEAPVQIVLTTTYQELPKLVCHQTFFSRLICPAVQWPSAAT